MISLKCDPRTPGELSGFTEQDTGSSQYVSTLQKGKDSNPSLGVLPCHEGEGLMV